MTRTSDAPCRAPILPGRAEISRGARTASAALASTKTASPAQSAFNIGMCSAHIRRQRPPPISRLCRRDPASGARSPRRCSRTEELDSRRSRGLFARVSRGPRAAHRLLQSIRSPSTTARSNEPRSPREGSPPSAAPSGHRATAFAASRRPRNGWPRPFRSTASRGSRVREHRVRRSIPCRAFPQRLLAVEAISPTRSARTPHVASTLRRRHGDTCAVETLETRVSTSSPGRAPLSQSCRRVGLLLVSPREREYNRLHPRCLS